MKKMMMGAVALSTALMLGTAAPAFAVVGIGDGELGDFTKAQDTDVDASQSTTVNLEATTTQVNATVPLVVVVSAPIEGGEMIEPTADAYKIVNKSTAGSLWVTDVEATLSGTDDWNAANTNDPSAVATRANTTTSTPKYGSVCMTLKAAVQEEADDPIVLVGKSPKTEVSWEIGKATVDADNGNAVTNTDCGLTLEGGNSQLSTAIDTTNTGDNAVELMKVKYTVTMIPQNL